jgi:hypothetical protein
VFRFEPLPGAVEHTVAPDEHHTLPLQATLALTTANYWKASYWLLS